MVADATAGNEGLRPELPTATAWLSQSTRRQPAVRRPRGRLSFVIDVFSRRVVGWTPASHMRTHLVLDALRMALIRRDHGAAVRLIHHSDARSQSTSFAFQQELDDHGVLASIGSVGDAYDNALAESFVESFKTELIRDRVWRAGTQRELAIVERVAWFNTERLHGALGDIPPAELEHLYARQTEPRQTR